MQITNRTKKFMGSSKTEESYRVDEQEAYRIIINDRAEYEAIVKAAKGVSAAVPGDAGILIWGDKIRTVIRTLTSQGKEKESRSLEIAASDSGADQTTLLYITYYF